MKFFCGTSLCILNSGVGMGDLSLMLEILYICGYNEMFVFPVFYRMGCKLCHCSLSITMGFIDSQDDNLAQALISSIQLHFSLPQFLLPSI